MNTRISYNVIMLLAIIYGLQGCKKYLDAKSDKSFSTPSTVADLQGLLDQTSFMNANCAETGEISADTYYVTDTIYNTLPLQDSRDIYLWKQATLPADWQDEYNTVYTANVVLDYLPKISRTPTNASVWDNCKGSALLFRGKSFLEIAQIWAKAYDSASSNNDLGIPLRLTSDYNPKSARASVENTYDQIISDFKAAIPLLPSTGLNVFRPSKAAAYGLLARTYLAMRKYQASKLYADSCLSIRSKLIDFNTLDSTQAYPFANIQYTNPEDIMNTNALIAYLDLYYGNIDSTLYNSYDTNDLRKFIYFVNDGTGKYTFRGSYDVYSNYNGVATDEVYLIRAESEARLGDINSSLEDLNNLLTNRYKTGSFSPVSLTNAADLVNYVLVERKKELVFRMLRFGDIKRLNLGGANISIKRVIGGQVYVLAPNDPRFALPIPVQVLQQSGIQNN